MIAGTEESLDEFVKRWRAVVQASELPTEKQLELDEFLDSVRLREFPGAILAWPRIDRPTVYYAVANDASEWRRLRPLLLAFAGPTVTSFTGRIEPLLPRIPPESLLADKGWAVVARMVAGKDKKTQEIASRSLKRMLSMVSSAPPTTRDAPRPTSQLLAQFVDALNGNNRKKAEDIISECRSELRLDALNLLFLKIQLLEHFGEWQAICDMPEFTSLSHTRKPRAVAMAMLEALYQVHLGEASLSLDLEHELAVWRQSIRPLALPLLRLPIPLASPHGAVRLYGLEALTVQPRNHSLEVALSGFSAVLGRIYTALIADGRASSAVASAPAATEVESALIAADDENTLEAIAHALQKLGELSLDDRTRILNSEALRLIIQDMQAETHGKRPPLTWAEWFERLVDPEFTNSLDILQHAVVEWPAQSIQDVQDISALSAAIANVPSITPAGERLADALPLLVAWVVKDPEFPRPGMVAVYEAMLFHFVVGSRRAAKTYESATILIRALLSIGLTAPQYRGLMDDCLELAGLGVGTRNIYWLLDILDETIASVTPDPDKRQSFWSAVHARLIPVQDRMTAGQHVAFRRLGAILGWTDSCAREVSPEQLDALSQLRVGLAGKHIAIYSLTDTATRQAEDALRDIAPEVRISISHDLVGNNALKSMAQRADIFVIATSSAKHAATGFIQQCRPADKPTLYAAGRGFTSIIRTIEDFLVQGT